MDDNNNDEGALWKADIMDVALLDKKLMDSEEVANINQRYQVAIGVHAYRSGKLFLKLNVSTRENKEQNGFNG